MRICYFFICSGDSISGSGGYLDQTSPLTTTSGATSFRFYLSFQFRLGYRTVRNVVNSEGIMLDDPLNTMAATYLYSAAELRHEDALRETERVTSQQRFENQMQALQVSGPDPGFSPSGYILQTGFRTDGGYDQVVAPDPDFEAIRNLTLAVEASAAGKALGATGGSGLNFTQSFLRIPYGAAAVPDAIAAGVITTQNAGLLNVDMEGGLSAAESLFNRLSYGARIESQTNRRGVITLAFLPNGATANLRTWSSRGFITVEVQNMPGLPEKVAFRFGRLLH